MMKKPMLMRVWLVFVGLFIFSPAIQAANVEKLSLANTVITWQVKLFNFFDVTGTLKAEGLLLLNRDDLKGSQIHVTIDTKTVSTPIALLNPILRSKNFFNTEVYPTATFASKKIELINATSAKIEGVLTLCGIAKPVILHVTLTKMHEHTDKNNMLKLDVNALLKRTDFGMISHLLEVNNEVEIVFQKRFDLAHSQ